MERGPRCWVGWLGLSRAGLGGEEVGVGTETVSERLGVFGQAVSLGFRSTSPTHSQEVLCNQDLIYSSRFDNPFSY